MEAGFKPLGPDKNAATIVQSETRTGHSVRVTRNLDHGGQGRTIGWTVTGLELAAAA